MRKTSICSWPAQVLLTGALAVFIAGCGGGGDGPAPVPSTPAGPAVEPPAVTSVPPAVYEDNRRTLAFNRLNEIRAQAGVGLLKQDAAVDKAAQSHSVYLLTNNEWTHTETPGKQGYTGASSYSRINYFGYKDLLESTEFASSLNSFDANPLRKTSADLVDSLISTPYHRSAMLLAEYSHVGVGLYDKDFSTALILNIARTAANSQGAPNSELIIWPPHQSNEIPTTMHNESPDPIKENNGAPAGYPASAQVSSLWYSLEVKSFEIRETVSGNLIDTKLLSAATDEELSKTFADHSFVAAIPRSPLRKNTNYTVIFEGIKTSAEDRKTKLVNKTWSFNTRN